LKTPTWTEVREFLKYDDWTEDPSRSSDHDYFEKEVDDDILIMDVSRAGSKTMSPGRFKTILNDQLKVAADQFWEVLRTKKPATRPAPHREPPPASLPLWLVRELERRGVLPQDIAGLDETAAHALLTKLRSQPQP
jgi:hypothetical protein